MRASLDSYQGHPNTHERHPRFPIIPKIRKPNETKADLSQRRDRFLLALALGLGGCVVGATSYYPGPGPGPVENDFWFYPSVGVYYDNQQGYYHYNSGGTWVKRRSYPPTFTAGWVPMSSSTTRDRAPGTTTTTTAAITPPSATGIIRPTRHPAMATDRGGMMISVRVTDFPLRADGRLLVITGQVGITSGRGTDPRATIPSGRAPDPRGAIARHRARVPDPLHAPPALAFRRGPRVWRAATNELPRSQGPGQVYPPRPVGNQPSPQPRPQPRPLPYRAMTNPG